jgi:4-amino-4-deoxy-L-arabinose transferase-like glycosyltransferase
MRVLMTQVKQTTAAMSPVCREPARVECVLLAAIILAAVALRLAYPSLIAVEHFDEGVYASNYWFDEEDDHRYPDSHLYAPPLLPSLAELSILVFGVSPLGCVLVSVAAGVFTVGLIWWVARQWFGTAAAIAATTLAALSDVHLVYSRTLLTDPLLCFWMLLAVYWIWESFRKPGPLKIIAAAMATALAWWTKYNGWLPLAVGLAGLLPWMILVKPPQRSAGRMLASWFVIALLAALLWSPALSNLHPYGGYSAVAENHRSYLVGLAGWFHSLWQQIENHRYLDGWFSASSVGLALLLPAIACRFGNRRELENSAADDGNDLTSRDADAGPAAAGMTTVLQRSTPGCYGPSWLLTIGLVSLLVGGASLIGTSPLLGIVAAGGILSTLLPARRRESVSDVEADRSLAGWLLAAWFCGLLVAIPLYLPFYPRLTLPWLVSAWLGAGAAVEGWVRICRQLDQNRARTTGPRRTVRAYLVFVGCVLVSGIMIVLSSARLSAHGVPGWQDHTGLQAVAEQIVRDAGERAAVLGKDRSGKFVVYVYAEPALFFHIRAQGVLAGPVTDLDFVHPRAPRLPLPTFFVAGPHAHSSETFRQQWARYGDRFEAVGTYAYAPSDLVLLNKFPPRTLDALNGRPLEEVRLYLAD